MAVHGRSVSYTPHATGTAVTIRGIFTDLGSGEDYDPAADHKNIVAVGVLKVYKSDVATPDLRDSVVIDSKKWAVEKIISDGAVMVELGLRAVENRQVGGTKGIVR
jgi:hypothetical protein